MWENKLWERRCSIHTIPKTKRATDDELSSIESSIEKLTTERMKAHLRDLRLGDDLRKPLPEGPPKAGKNASLTAKIIAKTTTTTNGVPLKRNTEGRNTHSNSKRINGLNLEPSRQ